MNRILFPLLALGMIPVAFFSLIIVSFIGLLGIGLFGLAKAISYFKGGVADQAQYGARAKTTNTYDYKFEHKSAQTGGINRVWNDGRGTIIDM